MSHIDFEEIPLVENEPVNVPFADIGLITGIIFFLSLFLKSLRS